MLYSIFTLLYYVFQLQGCIKAKHAEIEGIIIWPIEIKNFLIQKGHQPSSSTPSKEGTLVTMDLILSCL
jgi:hypothetical protein